MKEDKKKILEILKATTKKKSKFENLVLNLALQKVNSDRFEYDGQAVYTSDMTTLIYCLTNPIELLIPEGVKIVGRMALTQHSKLQKLTLPESLEKIEREAFADCDALEAVTIPASVKGIYGFAFAECDALREVVFEGVPEHIGRRTFIGCENLHIIRVPKGSADFFRKELHIIDDPDVLVIENEPTTEKVEKKEETEQKAEKEEK